MKAHAIHYSALNTHSHAYAWVIGWKNVKIEIWKYDFIFINSARGNFAVWTWNSSAWTSPVVFLLVNLLLSSSKIY